MIGATVSAERGRSERKREASSRSSARNTSPQLASPALRPCNAFEQLRLTASGELVRSFRVIHVEGDCVKVIARLVGSAGSPDRQVFTRVAPEVVDKAIFSVGDEFELGTSEDRRELLMRSNDIRSFSAEERDAMERRCEVDHTAYKASEQSFHQCVELFREFDKILRSTRRKRSQPRPG